MTTLREDVGRVLDALIDGTGDLEERLERAGEANAHDWMFAVREILHDVKRALALVADLPGHEDPAAVRDALKDISMEFVYMLGPHAQHHLGELFEAIERDETS